MKIMGHVDADCFYVSCERLRDARLLGKPVGVLGNQGACVIARSYEMKAAGVDVAMPIWIAKRICPEGIFVKRDFEWYGVLSHAMQEVVKQFSDEVEHYSVDESFANFGELQGDLNQLAHRIQDKMLKEVGIPVSVGLSTTRTLCKLASKQNKPFGTLVITEANREEVLSKTPLLQVNGIGRRLIQRCHQLGLYSAADYLNQSRSFIQQHFHKPGETLWYELRGIPILGIKTEKEEPKILSRGGSIWGHHTDPKYIWGFLVRNLERFLTALWKDNIEISTLMIVLVRSDWRQDTAVEALPDFTHDQDQILKALQQAFKRAYRKNVRYCRVHLIGQPIRSASRKQLNLLESSKRSSTLQKVTLDLNKRFGLFTVRKASTAFASDVFKDKVSDFEITDIEGKQLF